jgi:DNA-binding transcriptional LysR family regulator
VNISQLKTFLAVADRGSFSEAARALGISQPAVTMQVQALESDIGAVLFDRKYRHVEVTEPGRTLMPHARRVLEEIERAHTEIEQLGNQLTGRLTLAASTTPGQYVLPRLLGAFLHANPEVAAGIVIADTARVVELVEAGEAQLGMVGARVRGARATFEEAGEDELVLIAPPDSPLIDRDVLLLQDLFEEPFVMRESGSGTRLVTESTLRAEGVDPGDLRVVTELGTSEAIVRAIEGGLGLGIVSRWVADKALKLKTVAELMVGGFPVKRPLYLVLPRATLTRAADAFAEHLRTQLIRGYATPSSPPAGD